jgi:hypothetical protein
VVDEKDPLPLDENVTCEVGVEPATVAVQEADEPTPTDEG